GVRPAPVAAAPAAGARPPAGATPPAAARPPGTPPPFAEVVKDAKREDGFIPIWRKDEKVWLEITPERLGKPFLLSVNVKNAVGERGLYAGAMGPAWLAQFRKVGNQVQLVAINTDFRADGDPGNRIAVRESFSDSLVGSSAVASAEHPERKSVLVDAGFLLGDIAGYSTQLELAYRMPFAPDRANSFFDAARAEPGLTTLGGQVHYSVPRIAAPPLLPPGAPRPNIPPPPQTTPDPRSLFVGFVYNFRELPAEPMRPRPADPRVGYFTDSFTELSDDLRPTTRVHQINRWRLEKKDPSAAISEPVRPITFWIDRNTPLRYRKAVEEGILEWNKAFERIGFRNAIVAKQQPDDDPGSLLESGRASVRWFTGADVGYAAGPSHSDPRTGEILDADIVMSDIFGRLARREFREDLMPLQGLPAAPQQSFAARPNAGAPGWRGGLAALWEQGLAAQGGAPQACGLAMLAMNELHFAMDLLHARGDLDPESPEAEAFVQDFVKWVIMHEVGHTLGLRHNFISSTTVTRQQLKDKAFGERNGISNSVMDYPGFNLPLEGEPKGEFNMKGLGAYDYFAIEYGYRPLDPTLDAKAEVAELDRIASRQRTDPLLAFADDADAGWGDVGGYDPRVNLWDLGDDPLAYYQRSLQLARELWDRVQARGPRDGDDANRLRRSLLSGFRMLSSAPVNAAKYVGGVYAERDPQGRAGSRPAFRPVEPARQREALRFVSDALFKVDSFRFKPEFLSSLQPDFIEWNRAGPADIPGTVLALQTRALDRLLSAGVARRLLDQPNLVPAAQRKDLVSLNELYTTLQSAVWSELRSGQEIEPMRRSLQRAHLARLQGLLTRPGGALPADAYALARFQAVRLQAELRTASARRGLSVENRAHLEEALATLTEALRATLSRS
ncbi:MAG: zinc-dependent metalloprotease, partial [Burkholderiaceae bacterium]|nr:zinc-dependent metalloprotease [Burkholderiaceae bacterium]